MLRAPHKAITTGRMEESAVLLSSCATGPWCDQGGAQASYITRNDQRLGVHAHMRILLVSTQNNYNYSCTSCISTIRNAYASL